MPNLVSNRASITVPADLTYFVNGEEYLVINPELGARAVLTGREFRILQALARPGADGEPNPLEPTADNERTLARFVLKWLVYFNGNKPRIKHGEAALTYAYYAITNGCNLRCPYCYASSEKRLSGELTTAESIDLVTQVAEFGGQVMVFTGGEPMLRKDLFQIAEHANNIGLQSNIITNATMIRTPVIAKRFADLFGAVTVSVDGGTAETHDLTRGKGSFARTHKALRLLNEAGVIPQINHVVRSDNVDGLEGFAEFLNGLEVHSVRLMNHNDLGRGIGDTYDFGWTDHLRVQQIVWTSPVAAKLRPDGPNGPAKPPSPCSVKGNCGMGGNEIYINSLGDIYPCKLVTGDEHRAGNTRRQRLSEIFSSPVLAAMRRSTVFGGDYHRDCERCYVKANCGGGCRATHMSESGDLKSNSHHVCRILRHGVVSQLWLESGVTPAEMAANDLDMTHPRLVANDQTHPVFGQWRADAPTPVKLNKLIPITPVPRRLDGVSAHH
jgi:radical SAM protein with 4Fe4S-binding SPASM domain